MLAVFSDTSIAAIATAIAGLLTTIFSGLMVYFMARLKAQAEQAAAKQTEAAKKVETVAAKLEVTTANTENKLNAIAVVADATHMLGNSNMGMALKLNALNARKLAEITKDPIDLKAADAADEKLAQHTASQEKVDNKYPQGIGPHEAENTGNKPGLNPTPDQLARIVAATKMKEKIT
jgi:mannitol-specific phosphotransferase system IIBC component